MAVMQAANQNEAGLGTVRLTKVQRKGRKVQAKKGNLTCDFACGHFVVMTIDAVEGETLTVTRQKEEAEQGKCPWCRTVELGGREFAGEEPGRWSTVGMSLTPQKVMSEQEIKSVEKLLRGIIVSAEEMRLDPQPDLEELEAMKRCVDRIIEFAKKGQDEAIRPIQPESD